MTRVPWMARQRNKEYDREYSRRFREENPELARERQRDSRAIHGHKYNARHAQWKRDNKERCADLENARRARKLNQFVEDVDRLVLLELDDGLCGVCGSDVDPMSFHVDHVVPLSKGGEHSYANTQVAHPVCNIRKHATVDD